MQKSITCHEQTNLKEWKEELHGLPISPNDGSPNLSVTPNIRASFKSSIWSSQTIQTTAFCEMPKDTKDRHQMAIVCSTKHKTASCYTTIAIMFLSISCNRTLQTTHWWCANLPPNLFQSARVVHRNVAFFSLDAMSCSRWLAAVWEQVTILRSPGSRPSLPTILPADPPIHWRTNSFITLCPSIKNKENVNGIFRDPQYSDPFPILFPYHSHKNPWRYGNGMGIVWEAYHKEVPLLGVPEITLENAKHIHRHISIYVRV